MFDLSALHVGHVLFIAYTLLAGSVVAQLFRRGRRTFDDVFTHEDRKLVGAAAFYLGLPAVLVLHELVQIAVLAAFGIAPAQIARWIEQGALPSHHGALSHGQIVAVTSSGHVVAIAIGASMVWLAIRRPINAAWNFARLELGRVVLGVVLLLHPLLAVVLDTGSFAVLRDTLNAMLPYAGDGLIVAHLIVVGVALRVATSVRVRGLYVELTTPLFHAIETAKRELTRHPEHAAAHRDLGGAYLAASRFDLAGVPLARAVELAPADPRGHFLLGMLRLQQRDLSGAEAALCVAGQLLEAQDLPLNERRGLELEVTIALATVRLRLKDHEAALATAEAALVLARRDPRALVIYSDALVAAGRREDARAPLSLALEDARGPVEGEIRKRLEALERGR